MSFTGSLVTTTVGDYDWAYITKDFGYNSHAELARLRADGYQYYTTYWLNRRQLLAVYRRATRCKKL